MNKLILALVFFSSSYTLLAQQKADEIVGDWITSDKNAIIRCFKNGNHYFGKVLWYRPFDAKEEGHPINPIDNTRFLNTLCMKNFTFKTNEWSGGEIIDAYHNKSFTAFAKINENKKLEVTGYILFRWLSQTLTLERISPQILEKYVSKF